MDVLVVGGGLAGLTAAAFAQRAGAKVTVFEKASEAGGRALTTDASGFKLNLGPHALYCGGEALRGLRELGIETRGKRPPNAGLALLGEEIHELPGTGAALFRTTLLDRGEKLETAKRLVSLFVANVPETMTVAEWLRTIKGERAQKLFGALVRVSTYGADHAHMSARAALAQLALALKGHAVLYLDGGWSQLVDALRSRVNVVTGARVVAADANGIRLASGERVPGKPILAVTPHAVRELTGVDLAVRPVKAACLDVALRSLPKPENVFLLGMDRPLYYSVHSATAKIAPDGGAVIHVARYLSGEEAKREELESLLDRLQPGWRERVVHARFLPEMTVVQDMVEAGRARHAVDAIPGVLLAGDWIGSEGMLADAAVASGRRAAEIAVRERMAA